MRLFAARGSEALPDGGRKMLLFSVAVAALTLSLVQSVAVHYSCIDQSGQIAQCPGNTRPRSFTPQLVAYAKYANRINETGWAEWELVTNAAQRDASQAYFAGYLEGFVTAQLIRSARQNMLREDKYRWCEVLSPLIEVNLNSTVERVNRNPRSLYWQQVGLTLNQLAGLDDGYSLAQGGPAHTRRPHMSIDPCGLILLNLKTELGDILSILNHSLMEPKMQHCSALVKYLPQTGEVYVAHNSWTSYTWMLRVLKRYTLNFSVSKAKSIALSSYPGTIFSIDDFYITSTNLVVVETSIANFNDQLWSHVKVKEIVFEFIRNTVANRLATNGSEWAHYFSRKNSGSYNNQFIITDYKQLGKTSGLLTVLEQLPGIVEFSDQTAHLLKQSYWPSYNVPFYPYIYQKSEYDRMYDKYGDFFSYEKTARALIFKRDHGKVANLTTLYHLMRYNDFQHDPLSRCSNCTPPYDGKYAIAARSDLNDPHGSYPFAFIGFKDEGAIDAKMTSAALAKDLQMIAVSGPTDENVPAFSWATTKLTDASHVDQPIEWKFKPVKTVWGRDEVFPNYHFDL